MRCSTFRLLTRCVLILSIFAVAAYSDTLLHVTTLSPELEATFSVHDGILSPFWTDGSVVIDTILLTVGGNATEGSLPWSGDEDARMWVGSTASGTGLYLCAVASDDVFVRSDVVELFVDTTPKSAINSDILYARGWGLVTWKTFRFRFYVGDTTLWQLAHVWMYDHAFDNWLRNETDTGSFRSQYGLLFEYIRISDTDRAVELFVPWSILSEQLWYGDGSWPAGTPLANRRLSFAAGYSDYDAPGDSGAIFWTRGSPMDDTAKNYWGELQLAADMPPVAETLSLAPRLQRIPREQDAREARYYSIAGRALRGPGGVRAGARGTVLVRVDGSGGARLVLRQLDNVRLKQ